MVSRTTERRNARFTNTGHHWLREVFPIVRVGWHPFRVPSPTSLVWLHHHHHISSSSSTFPSTSISITLKYHGTRGTHNLTRHNNQGVMLLVATMPLASERVLEDKAMIRVEAKVRLVLRHMRCTPPMITTPQQVLLCYLFSVLGLMIYLILGHHILLYHVVSKFAQVKVWALKFYFEYGHSTQ